MKALTILMVGAILLMVGCGRQDDGSMAPTTTTAPKPIETVAAPTVQPMPVAVKYRSLPKSVDETTTETALRVHAFIVATEDLNAAYILPQEMPERIDFLMSQWLPALNDFKARLAQGQAAREAWDQIDLEWAENIAKYEAKSSEIDAQHYREMKEDSVKQIRIISERTYENLDNLGRPPGCRIGASRPPQ